MTIKVDLSDMPEDVADALMTGHTVEVQKDGEVVARVEPCQKDSDWKAFFDERKKDPPLDYDGFMADLELVRRQLNACPASPSSATP